jgi:hypothetical protein
MPSIPYGGKNDPFTYKAPRKTLASQRNLSEIVSKDEIDYVRKKARHAEDPLHWSMSIPPSPHKRPAYKTEYD